MADHDIRPSLTEAEPPGVDIVVELRAHAEELAKTWKEDSAEIVAMRKAATTIVYLREANRRLIGELATANERLATGAEQFKAIRAELAALQPDGEAR